MKENYVTQFDALPGVESPVQRLPRASGNRNPVDWFREYIHGAESDSGERITPTSALNHSPVWQAINILAGDIGQLKFSVFRKAQDESGTVLRHDPTHPVDWAISGEPNAHQTADVWLETMLAWALGWGNGISAIERHGREIQLVPLLPSVTNVVEDEGRRFIRTRIGDREKLFAPEEVWHLRGLTHDGFWGQSAVHVCRNRIGYGKALHRHGSRVFKSGVRPSGVLQAPSEVEMSLEARKNLRQEWEEMHAGAENTGKIAILWDGIEWNPMSMSNQDAQWLAAVELDPVFVAGTFGLPPYKLGALKNSSVRANLEAQQKEYFNTSLSRWVNRVKTETMRKLFLGPERRARRFAIHVDADVLTQGTRKERAETVALLRNARLITQNEGRAEFGLNPVDGGDTFENPAIDPVRDITSSPDEEEFANVMRRRGVEPLLRAEVGRLKHAAKTVNNFVNWAANYYGGYTEQAAEFIEPIAKMDQRLGVSQGWREVVERHARESLSELLSLTDTVQQDGLALAVGEYTEIITGKAASLTHKIVQGTIDG